MATSTKQTQAIVDPVTPTEDEASAMQLTTESGEAHDEEGPVGVLVAPVEGGAKATGRVQVPPAPAGQEAPLAIQPVEIGLEGLV